MGDGHQGRLDIRPITTADFEALCGVIAEVDTFHREALPHMFRKAEGPAREPGYVQDLVDNPDVGLFGAWVDGTLAGYVHAVITPRPNYAIVVPRKVVLVDGLAVKQAFRRQGLARRLMARAEAFAAEVDADALELKVYEFNQGAIAFYEALGYNVYYRGMTKNL